MNQDDFQPMESFDLRWKWGSDRCAITPDELAQIRPFSKSCAAKIWERSMQFVEEKHTGNSFRPSRDLFPHIVDLNLENQEVEEVQGWLFAQVERETEPLIVCWDSNHAVLTSWPIFVFYWDDFCYALADDVSIWPISESWLLHFWHEEVFYFAR